MNFLSISWWRSISQKMGRSVGWGCMLIFGLPLVIGFGGWGWSQYANRGAQSNSPAADGVLVTVNGDTITAQNFYRIQAQMKSVQPGPEYASEQGQIVNMLIQHKVLTQMAKAANVHPADADIDRTVAQQREQALGTKATQSDWDSFVYDHFQQSPEEYREQVADGLIGKTLVDHAKSLEKVTPEEAKQQSGEVHLSVVIIPTPSSNTLMPTPPSPKTLPDADAKAKADLLLTQVRAGSDFAKVAKDNSGDASAARGGDIDWSHEYEGGPLQAYGKDFVEAVHKTAIGQITDVVKLSGLKSGYIFARVMDRRNTLPKDYDEKKVTDQLKEQRAGEKLGKELAANMKSAKIVFPKGQEDKKAYYDYYKYTEMEQQQLMAQFGQPGEETPTAAEVAAQKTLADGEIEGIYQRHAKDGTNDGATAALLLAEALKSKLPTTPAAEQPQVREKLITYYETALKMTESSEMRFDLAKLYMEKKDLDSAEAQLKKIASMLASNPPFDLNSMQDAKRTHQQLYTSFHLLDTPIAPRPTAAAAAQKEQDALQALEPRLKREQEKAAEEERKKKAAQPGATPGMPPGLSLPGGGSMPEMPAPDSGTPTSGGAPAPGAGSTPNPGASTPAPKPGAAPASTGKPGSSR